MIEQLTRPGPGSSSSSTGSSFPDWGSLVNLLPIFLVVGVVGPLLR